MSMYKGKRQRQFPTTIGTTTFVKIYILHLLIEKHYYGNELKDEISKRVDYKWSPSPGMIYPLLRELESLSYIEGWWEEPTKRSIRRYKITDSGIKHYNTIVLKHRSSFDDSLVIIRSVLKDIYGEK